MSRPRRGWRRRRCTIDWLTPSRCDGRATAKAAAAPPAELLESVLKRRQVAAETNGPGCRLQLVLDEFVQRFDTPQSSQVVLEARGVLLPARGGDMLARRGFRILKPAKTADARGGAAAAREAAMALADELAAWSNELATAKAAVAERCRN